MFFIILCFVYHCKSFGYEFAFLGRILGDEYFCTLNICDENFKI